MNQPKFKFGDKVKTTSGAVITIDYIKRTPKYGYYYTDDSSIYDWQRECDIELYQEPQKKKLFAYKLTDNSGRVQFFKQEYIGMYSVTHERLSEYDIEYPEAK